MDSIDGARCAGAHARAPTHVHGFLDPHGHVPLRVQIPQEGTYEVGEDLRLQSSQAARTQAEVVSVVALTGGGSQRRQVCLDGGAPRVFPPPVPNPDPTPIPLAHAWMAARMRRVSSPTRPSACRLNATLPGLAARMRQVSHPVPPQNVPGWRRACGG